MKNNTYIQRHIHHTRTLPVTAANGQYHWYVWCSRYLIVLSLWCGSQTYMRLAHRHMHILRYHSSNAIILQPEVKDIYINASPLIIISFYTQRDSPMTKDKLILTATFQHYWICIFAMGNLFLRYAITLYSFWIEFDEWTYIMCITILQKLEIGDRIFLLLVLRLSAMFLPVYSM